MMRFGWHVTLVLAGGLLFVASCGEDEKEEPKSCSPACSANTCTVCDLTGTSPTCVSTCGDGLSCQDGKCVAPVEVTCSPACDDCQACDTTGPTPACVDICTAGLLCNAGRCEAPPPVVCNPACNACQTCDISGLAPVCVDNCAAGMICNTGVCEPPPPPACDPACAPCQVCDVSGVAPVCLDTCGQGEVCDAGACIRGGIHQTFSQLDGPFANGPEVTTQCLTCHQQQADDFKMTPHWNWAGATPGMAGHEGDTDKGKNNLINNFCVAVPSNEGRCSECHAGYGYANQSFDFSDETKIDCLICHADPRAGYYKEKKTAGAAGLTADLVRAAKSVGEPERANCGACHFFAGGGDNVKKGDLGTAMGNPDADADVHMGNSFSCANCHAGDNHALLGQGVHLPVSEGRLSCEDCHGAAPHTLGTAGDVSIRNNHAQDVACQTCHIPAFSRQQPTKMNWDWATAGNKERGTAGVETAVVNGVTVPVYDFMKGDFVWQGNVRPEYGWWDGRVSRMLTTDQYASGQGTLGDPVQLGKPLATHADAGAKIFPFKVMRGRQPGDITATGKFMIVPKLFGPGGFWGAIPATYDAGVVTELWSEALDAGAVVAGQTLPTDGDYTFGTEWDWLYTEMYLGINHEVAPANAALTCADCHFGNAEFDFTDFGYTCDPAMSSGCGSRH